jgi:hypothetical protein
MRSSAAATWGLVVEGLRGLLALLEYLGQPFPCQRLGVDRMQPLAWKLDTTGPAKIGVDWPVRRLGLAAVLHPAVVERGGHPLEEAHRLALDRVEAYRS